jgi:hypothetical protein
MRTPICDSTCPVACTVCDPQLLHNMSVPPTSRITVTRARFPGLRFAVRFPVEGRWAHLLPHRLAKGGWRAAWTLLEARDDAPPRKGRRTRRQEDLERHLRESLEKAGVPDRLGVFLHEDDVAPEDAAPLGPAAALAVLARRSGPLYVPSRRLEPSLADPSRRLVLLFPEEETR